MKSPILNHEYSGLLARLHDHLRDEGNIDLPLQLLKLSEEIGETVRAYIAVNGLNPRKGRSGNEIDVVDELADVVIVALVAIRMAGYDPNNILYRQAMKTEERLNEYDKRVTSATESLESQINRLGQFIMHNISGEPSRGDEGAVDCAIRLLKDGLTSNRGMSNGTSKT